MEQPTPNVPGTDSGLKNKFVKSAVILLTVFLFIGGLAYVWQKWLSPNAQVRWKYDLYQKFYVDRYENAMREDVWGGETPQETLDLFIEALKNNDIELAAKYFALNTNENSEYYLTRKEWEEAVRKTKEEKGFEQIILDLEKAKFQSESKEMGSSWFVTFNEDGSLKQDILFTFNKYSGVWKVESM